MTPQRREILLAIMDNDYELIGVAHILNGYVHCDAICSWLIEHKYVGKNLRELVVKKFASSVPKLVDYVVLKINVNQEKHQLLEAPFPP